MNKQTKPIALFEKLLVLDSETTGLQQGSCLAPGQAPKGGYYQMVSVGMIIADFKTLKPIEELYVEIQWDGKSIWSDGAEKVHGLSIEHLQKHGIPEEDAVFEIGSLLLKHWGPVNTINVGGHNPSFDIAFLDDMFKRHDIALHFSHRSYDSNTLGGILLDCFTSDQLFDIMGLPVRQKHNSLDDARYSLECMRKIKLLWNTFV